MITNAILNVLYFAIDLLLTPLKNLTDVSANSSFISAISTINTYINNINNFFPVYTLIAILFLIIAIEFAIFTYKGVMWGIKIIRGSG